MKDGPKMRKSNYTTTMIEIIEKHVEQGDGAATIIKKNPLHCTLYTAVHTPVQYSVQLYCTQSDLHIL